jgi:hypothetical protein
VSIEETILELVEERIEWDAKVRGFLENNDLRGVINAEDIDEAVAAIIDNYVDYDFINEKIDTDTIVESVTNHLDLTYEIERVIDNNYSFVGSDDINEYVVSEIDSLLSEFDPDTACGTVKKFVRAVRTIVSKEELPEGVSAYHLQGLIQDEMKKVLAEPVRTMIQEELATHAIRKMANDAIQEAWETFAPTIYDIVKNQVNILLAEEARTSYESILRMHLRRLFSTLANESVTVQPPEPVSTNGDH